MSTNKDKQAKARWQKMAGILKEGDNPESDPWEFGDSPEDKEREELAYVVWDLYKDVYGIRPRHMHFSSKSKEELLSDIDDLEHQFEQQTSEDGLQHFGFPPPEDEEHFVQSEPTEEEIDDMAKHYGYDPELETLPMFGGKKLKEAHRQHNEPEELKKMTDEAMAKASQVLKKLAGMEKPLGSNEHVELLSVIMDATQDAYNMGMDDGYKECEHDILGEREAEDRLEHERYETSQLHRLEEEDESGIKSFYKDAADRVEKILNKDATHLFDKTVRQVVRPLANIIGQSIAHPEPFHVRQAKSAPKHTERKPLAAKVITKENSNNKKAKGQ